MRKIICIISVCLVWLMLAPVVWAYEPPLPKFGWDKDFAYITDYMGEYHRKIAFGAELFDAEIEKRRTIKNPPPDKDYTGSVRYIESVFGYPFEFSLVFYHDALASQSYHFESEQMSLAEFKPLAAKLIEIANRYTGAGPNLVFEKDYRTGKEDPSESWIYTGVWEAGGIRVRVQAHSEINYARIGIVFWNMDNPFTALLTRHRKAVSWQTPPVSAQRVILPELDVMWGMGLDEVYAIINQPASISAESNSPLLLTYGPQYYDKEMVLQYQFNDGLSDIMLDVRGKSDYIEYNALLDYLENSFSRRFDVPRQTVLKRNKENPAFAMFSTISKWNHSDTFVYIHSSYNQKDESYFVQIRLFDRQNPVNKDEIRGLNRHLGGGFPMMHQLILLQRYMFTPWKMD